MQLGLALGTEEFPCSFYDIIIQFSNYNKYATNPRCEPALMLFHVLHATRLVKLSSDTVIILRSSSTLTKYIMKYSAVIQIQNTIEKVVYYQGTLNIFLTDSGNILQLSFSHQYLIFLSF